MNNIYNKKQYNSIDLCKFLMAICVIAIHTQPVINYNNIWYTKIFENIVQCAVPFFFLSTGYLLAKKMKWPYNNEESINKIKSYIKKFLKLYLLWSIIYLPLSMYGYMKPGIPFKYSIYTYVRRFIFVGEHYNSWMLWYLLSSIYAFSFIKMLLKKGINPYIIFAIGSLIFGFGEIIMKIKMPDVLFIKILRNIINKTIENERILSGFFYLPCGMVLSKIRCRKKPIYILIFLIAFTLRSIVKSTIIIDILTILEGTSLFMFVINVELKYSPVYIELREMSQIMFFIHLYVWTIFYRLTYGKKSWGMETFLGTAVFSIIIAFIYIKIKEIIKKKYDNKLTSSS